MTDKSSVAVIIPVYNQRATIIEAIESVLEQSRPPDEIVVVDDGSTDGSGDIVERKFGPKVRVIRQPNRGVATARNTGIRMSSSSLIAFLDADDKWFPERIERQVEFMESHRGCMLSFSAHVRAYQ